MATILADDLNQSNKSYFWNPPELTPSTIIHSPRTSLNHIQQIEVTEFSKDKTHAVILNQGTSLRSMYICLD